MPTSSLPHGPPLTQKLWRWHHNSLMLQQQRGQSVTCHRGQTVLHQPRLLLRQLLKADQAFRGRPSMLNRTGRARHTDRDSWQSLQLCQLSMHAQTRISIQVALPTLMLHWFCRAC